MRSFHEQLEKEIAVYERLKRGEVDELLHLHGLGQLLVSLRIARGLTHRQLAETLGRELRSRVELFEAGKTAVV